MTERWLQSDTENIKEADGDRKTVTGLVDMHVHSSYSADSDTGLAEYADRAGELGLKGLCFAEHADYNPAEEHFGFFSYQDFTLSFQALQDSLGEGKNKLFLLKGIEYSEPHLYSKKFQQLKKKKFDMIMAAVHWVKGGFVGNEEIIAEYPPREIFACYYDKLLKTARFGGFDVLAHFDFPRRYLGAEAAEGFAEIEREILKKLVEQNIALEINTSPVRKAGLEPMPSARILSEYYRLGGQMVTLGSDAHSLEELGRDLEQAYRVVREIGLTAGYFKSRTFISYGLEI